MCVQSKTTDVILVKGATDLFAIRSINIQEVKGKPQYLQCHTRDFILIHQTHSIIRNKGKSKENVNFGDQ